MTHLFRQLRVREDEGRPIRVGIVGAGFMGRGLVYQLSRMSGLFPSLVVSRRLEQGIEAFASAGFARREVVVSDAPHVLEECAWAQRPLVTDCLESAIATAPLDVIIEATGSVENGARVALLCCRHRKHIVLLNAETDATVGCLLKRRADEAGIVYTNGDGDQPGVLMRLIDYCRGCGFDVRAAVNCKGFLDVLATPESIRPWALRQNTSPRMTAAFTDGTKLNIEQNVVCNAAGLAPQHRGMTGIRTSLKSAVDDFRAAGVLDGSPTVDYTLGGDFGGGVFVIARAEDPRMVQPYLKYLKMGDGPDYLFFRPYHLCHVETPLSAAEAVLYEQPTIAPLSGPVAQTVAIAKRDLEAGEELDGIGGFTLYGEVTASTEAEGLLPIGLAEGVKLLRPVRQHEPVPLDAVHLDESQLLVQLWREQQALDDASVEFAERRRRPARIALAR